MAVYGTLPAMPGAGLKIGVIGCGAIAQIQHLPHLRELDAEFEIGGLCDVSPRLLEALGDEYGVPPERRFLDYHDLVCSAIDAVIVCPSGSHAAPSIAAAEAGKHVLVEKPMSTTVREAEAMVEIADRAGVLLMVAYMKRHEPAYQFAQARVREMTDVRFIQVNHLHPDNSLHTAEFKVHRFDDVARQVIEASRAEEVALLSEALGDPQPSEAERRAYNLILGSMIHDIGNLHGLFGAPQRLLSAEIWLDGRAVTTTLDYDEERRAVASWVDLPELWDFKETLEVYGSSERVLVSFPTGFSRGLPSYVTLHGMDADRTPWRREYTWHDNPFKLEACSGLAAQVEGGAQARRRQARGTPSKRCGQIRQAFGEHLAATPAHPADKPADARVQDDTVETTRQISQRPLVLRVFALGP